MSQPLPVSPSPSTSVATAPTQPQTFVVDPYGSGATFGWTRPTGETLIPKPGDSDFVAYNQALSNWLDQRYATYLESPKYQQDQYNNNPDVRSGAIPTIGYVAEAPNAWGVPVGATVTAVTKTGDSYQIAYREQGEPQQVKIEGPGYAIEGTVYARDAQTAALITMGGVKAQYLGLDVSPSRLGGYISDMQGNDRASVQVGDPARNKYWADLGLAQYAGYNIPSLSSEQQAAGFYIKDITAAGDAPAVTVANSKWEQFWEGQGYSQYSNYEPPTLSEGDYIKTVTQTDQGVTYTIGNRAAEAKAASDEAKLAEINRQLGVINTQSSVFSDALSSGKIKPNEYQKAMSVQNQNTLNLLNEAEGLGFITSGEKQAQVNQMSAFMVDVDSYVKAYDKYTGVTGKISRENEVFAASLQSGKITQQEYNVAIGVQNQLQIRAIKEASIEGVINPTVAESSIAEININYQQFLNSQKVNAPFSTPTVSSGLANAANMASIKAQASNLSARQGTRTTGISEAQILSTLTPEEQKVYTDQKTQQAIFKGVSAGAFVLAGATVPLSLPTSITLSGIKVLVTEVILGAGVSVGVNEAVNYGVTKQWLTPQQVALSAGEGALFAVLGRGGLNALSRVAPTVSASLLGQAGVNTAMGASVGYFVSGGDPAQAAIGGGAAFGFTLLGAGLSRVNVRLRITDRITTPITERVTNPVLKSQRVLGRLDAIQTNYETSVQANRLPRYSTTDRLTMELVDAYPIRGKPEFLGLLTTPTTTQWRADERGFITDKFAPDMGVTVNTKSKTVTPESARGPNIWEGELTLQRGEVIRYKTLMEAELANPSTTLIGRSEAPETLYATDRTVTQSLGSSTQKPLGETTQKVKVKTQAEKNFETNRVVDDYLASFSDDIAPQRIVIEQEVLATQPISRILNENVKVVSPGIRGKAANDVQAQLQAEELGVARNAEYMDPAQFEQARSLFQQTRGGEITEQIITEAVQPTGVSKVASDIQFERTIDTGRYGIRGNPNTIKAFTTIPKTEATQTPRETAEPLTFTTLELAALTQADILRVNLALNDQPIKATEQIISPRQNLSLQSFPQINLAETVTAQPKTRDTPTPTAIINTFIGPEVNITPEPITDPLTQTELSPQLETALQTQTLTAIEEQPLTEIQEALSMPPITVRIPLTDTIDLPSEESEDDRKKKKKKSDLDEIIETFTAFRTKSRIKIEPLSDEIVKRQPGVEKQVVTARLVNFYPTSAKKLPKEFKAKKGENEYFRVVTIGGVRGVGQFKGTGRALDFYPANKKNKSVLDEGNEWLT